MCFSATASFTASAVLGITGIATLRQVKFKSLIFLACLPLLFAIQQFNEGLIWLYFGTKHVHIVMFSLQPGAFLELY